MKLLHKARRIVERIRRLSMYQWLRKTCWRGAQARPAYHFSGVIDTSEPVDLIQAQLISYQVTFYSEHVVGSGPNPLVQHLNEVSYYYNTPHEHDIAQSRRNFQEARERKLLQYGYDACLRLHYSMGGPHPHDYNIPLNRWEEIKD